MGSVAALIVLFIPNIFNGIANACIGGISNSIKLDSLSLESLTAILFGLLLSLFFLTVYCCLYLFLNLGWLRLLLGFVDENRLELGDLFSAMRYFVKYTAAASIFYTVFTLGLIFLGIPSIYFAIKWTFYEYAIIDENAGPISCLTRSSQITAGNWWKLFLFNILVGLINIALLLPAIILIVIGIALGALSPLIGVPIGILGLILIFPSVCISYWLSGLMRTKVYRSLNPIEAAAPMV